MARELWRVLAPAARHLGRRAHAVALARALGDRRPDGAVLLPGRDGNQARARDRGALVARARHAAALRRDRRNDRAGRDLREPARGRAGGLRLGRSDGDRHRLRGGCAHGLRQARSLGAQGLPAGARDRRRSRRGQRDRRLLHTRDLARRARLRRRRARGGVRCATCRGSILRRVLDRWARDLVRDARLRRARDRRRRGARPADTHPRGRSELGRRVLADREADARAASVVGLPRAADLRARERGRPDRCARARRSAREPRDVRRGVGDGRHSVAPGDQRLLPHSPVG